jgi:Protein of unknown function (DUF3379)
MMDHEQFRTALMADPRSEDAQLRAHREECAQCRAYAERLLEFEARLERAMRVRLPGRAQTAPFARKTASAGPPTRRWLAIAASVLLGVAVAGGVYLSLPQRSLAAAVVAHMAGEPGAWQRTDVAVDAPALAEVLKDSKLQLKPQAGIVSYASSCSFRGHVVPHLVVQTASGPVTVMVLVHEPVRKSMEFNEQGYRGTIVPIAGHGSIAVLMRGSRISREEIDRIAARVDDSIVWTR